ncbi:hypothetical protein V6N12_049085 [Hibiscus sabdariffa]|uniref:Uncharacterized protein n=1 Tax=Hibiscus sabdariffa TaxID=183260 RepID=A0ABR2EJ57_9ROSI
MKIQTRTPLLYRQPLSSGLTGRNMLRLLRDLHHNFDLKLPGYLRSRVKLLRKVNRIVDILDDDGEEVIGDDTLVALATDYFASLFTTQGPAPDSEIPNQIPSVITEEMNANLTRPFSKEEVWNALQDMHSLKGSIEDGFGAIFFQKF